MKNRLILIAIWLLCLVASLYAAVRMLYCIFKNPQKAWVLAVSHDQLANAASNGDPDETISSRANRYMPENKWACRLCKLLDFLDKNHCKDSAGI